MSLKKKLLDDMKAAMKEKDALRKNVIQMVRSAILTVKKNRQVLLQDNEIIDVIAKELKKRKDSLPEYEKNGRQDLIETGTVSLRDMGTVMKEVMPQVKGRADGKEVSRIVKKMLI